MLQRSEFIRIKAQAKAIESLCNEALERFDIITVNDIIDIHGAIRVAADDIRNEASDGD